MMTLLRRLLPLIAAAMLLAAAGCSTGACYDNQNSLPKAGFYSAATGEAVSVSGVAIGGVGAPGDSLLCSASETLSEVYLPFRPKESSTQFAFTVGMFADVVTFTYETIPYFASADCGAMWRFRIKSVSWAGSMIDSIAVVDSLITNADVEQLKIFLNPTEQDDETEENQGTGEEPEQ